MAHGPCYHPHSHPLPIAGPDLTRASATNWLPHAVHLWSFHLIAWSYRRRHRAATGHAARWKFNTHQNLLQWIFNAGRAENTATDQRDLYIPPTSGTRKYFTPCFAYWPKETHSRLLNHRYIYQSSISLICYCMAHASHAAYCYLTLRIWNLLYANILFLIHLTVTRQCKYHGSYHRLRHKNDCKYWHFIDFWHYILKRNVSSFPHWFVYMRMPLIITYQYCLF